MYFNKKINRNESVFNKGELINFSDDKILDIQINLTEAYDKFIKSEMDIFIFLYNHVDESGNYIQQKYCDELKNDLLFNECQKIKINEEITFEKFQEYFVKFEKQITDIEEKILIDLIKIGNDFTFDVKRFNSKKIMFLIDVATNFYNNVFIEIDKSMVQHEMVKIICKNKCKQYVKTFETNLYLPINYLFFNKLLIYLKSFKQSLSSNF